MRRSAGPILLLALLLATGPATPAATPATRDGAEVIVAAGSIGFQVRLGCMPAATARIMVSPTAREIPRMQAAVRPETAAGTTTWIAVWSLVAPIA